MSTLTLSNTDGNIYNIYKLDGKSIFDSYLDKRKLEYLLGATLTNWSDNEVTQEQAQVLLDYQDFKMSTRSLPYQKDATANDWYYEKAYPGYIIRQYTLENNGTLGLVKINLN